MKKLNFKSKKVTDWMGKACKPDRESMETRNDRIQWIWDHYIVEQREPWVVSYGGGRLVIMHRGLGTGTMEVYECIVERMGIMPRPKKGEK